MKRSRRLRNEALRGRCPGDGVSRMEGDVAYADSSLLCRIRSVGDAEKTLPTITTDVVSISNETGTEDVAKYMECAAVPYPHCKCCRAIASYHHEGCCHRNARNVKKSTGTQGNCRQLDDASRDTNMPYAHCAQKRDAPGNGAWVRDLTEEGIEPLPGPSSVGHGEVYPMTSDGEDRIDCASSNEVQTTNGTATKARSQTEPCELRDRVEARERMSKRPAVGLVASGQCREAEPCPMQKWFAKPGCIKFERVFQFMASKDLKRLRVVGRISGSEANRRLKQVYGVWTQEDEMRFLEEIKVYAEQIQAGTQMLTASRRSINATALDEGEGGLRERRNARGGVLFVTSVSPADADCGNTTKVDAAETSADETRNREMREVEKETNSCREPDATNSILRRYYRGKEFHPFYRYDNEERRTRVKFEDIARILDEVEVDNEQIIRNAAQWIPTSTDSVKKKLMKRLNRLVGRSS